MVNDGKLTVRQVINKVTNAFGDTGNIQINDALVIDWINEACREATMQIEDLQQNLTTIPLLTHGVAYPMPARCFLVRNVELSDLTTDGVTNLTKTTAQEAFRTFGDNWRLTYSDVPTHWWIWDSTYIYIYPAPNVGGLHGLLVTYSQYPEDVVDENDLIDLPAFLHLYVVHYCMMKAYEMDEDWEAHDRKAALVQSTLNFNNARQHGDVFPSITIIGEDSYGF